MSKQHLSGAKSTSYTLAELTQAADSLQANGQYQEASELYRQWLENAKDDCKHVAWFNYGWLLQKQSKFDEASNAYNALTDNYASYLSGHAAMA